MGGRVKFFIPRQISSFKYNASLFCMCIPKQICAHIRARVRVEAPFHRKGGNLARK